MPLFPYNPKKYTVLLGLVKFCSPHQFVVNFYNLLTHIPPGYFTGIGEIVAPVAVTEAEGYG